MEKVDSWSEVNTRTLWRTLEVIKGNIRELDPELEDFSVTGNLLIDLYEVSEELEKRMDFVPGGNHE